MKEILKLDHIQKYYGNGGNVTKAIQDISFSVQEGELSCSGVMEATAPVTSLLRMTPYPMATTSSSSRLLAERRTLGIVCPAATVWTWVS